MLFSKQVNIQQFDTPEAPFKIILPSGWIAIKPEKGKGGVRIITPWLWSLVKNPEVSSINIDSRNSYEEVSWKNIKDLGEFMTKTLAWDFKRFSVAVQTEVKNGYWIASCEFNQGKKERWFYKLRRIVHGKKEAYLTYNCLIDTLSEDEFQKELAEVNQIFDSFEFA